MPKTIFVVDDDNAISEVVSIVLTDEGYKVIALADYEAFTKALDKHTPQLVFLDITLGGKNGMDILAEIKKGDKTKEIPVVIMSARSELREVVKNSKADGFLEKPFDIDTLSGVAKKYCK